MTPPQSGPGSLPRGAEDIWALMQRLQPFEGRFSPSDSASQAITTATTPSAKFRPPSRRGARPGSWSSPFECALRRDVANRLWVRHFGETSLYIYAKQSMYRCLQREICLQKSKILLKTPRAFSRPDGADQKSG